MSLTPTTPEQSYADLQQRIQELNDLSGDNLAKAMIDLKKALMANPDACKLMLPEEVGQMVAALRRITSQHAVAESLKPKGRGAAKPKALTEEEMNAAFAEL